MFNTTCDTCNTVFNATLLSNAKKLTHFAITLVLICNTLKLRHFEIRVSPLKIENED